MDTEPVNPPHSTVCIAHGWVQSPGHGPRLGFFSIFFYFFSTGHIRTIPPGSRLTIHSSHHLPGAQNTLWASLTAAAEEVQSIPRLRRRLQPQDPGWGSRRRRTNPAPAKDSPVLTSSREIRWQQLPREWQWLRVLEQEVGEGALRQHHPSQSHADSNGSGLPARLSLIPEEGGRVWWSSLVGSEGGAGPASLSVTATRKSSWP